MIKVECLNKVYGETHAVKNLDLTVGSGEIFGFLGPNGAGKTTTIRILNGLVKPTSGHVSLGGIDIVSRHLEAKALVGYIPDRPYLYEKLTGYEFIIFVGGLYGLDRATSLERSRPYLEAFSMDGFAGHLIEGFSHGMKQKLMFTAAFINEPPILIVGEPMVGLDPKSARVVLKLFREKAEAGVAILLSTHTLSIVEQVCGRVGIINNGRLIATGSVADLLDRARLPGSNLEEVFLQLTEEELGTAPAAEA